MSGLTALCMTANGCSEIDANSTSASNLTKYNGLWTVSGGTRTASPDEGGNCGYGIGAGTFDISGATVSGEITDDSGYSYELEGTVDELGVITGAFSYKGYDAATFDGNLSDAAGGGAWQDINGCPGKWETRRKEERPDSVREAS